MKNYSKVRIHKDILPNPKFEFLLKAASSFVDDTDVMVELSRKDKKRLCKQSIADIRLRFLKEIRIALNSFKRDGGSFSWINLDKERCEMALSLGVDRKKSKVCVNDIRMLGLARTAFFKQYPITLIRGVCLSKGIGSFDKYSTENVDELLHIFVSDDEEICIRRYEHIEKEKKRGGW